MSIYLDTITLVWAMSLLFLFSKLMLTRKNLNSVLGFLAYTTYLVAQSSWTTSYLMGNVYGAMWANYIWFCFNFLSFSIMTLSLWSYGDET